MARIKAADIERIKREYKDEIDGIYTEIENCQSADESLEMVQSLWQIEEWKFNILDIMVLSDQYISQEMIDSLEEIGITSNLTKRTVRSIIGDGEKTKITLEKIAVGIANDRVVIDQEALDSITALRDTLCRRDINGTMKNKSYFGLFNEVIDLIRMRLDEIQKAEKTTGAASVVAAEKVSPTSQDKSKD